MKKLVTIFALIATSLFAYDGVIVYDGTEKMEIDSNGAISTVIKSASGNAQAVDANGSASITIKDDAGIPVGADSSTESLYTIDYPHHEVHSGSMYHIEDYVDLAINAVYDMQWTVPSTNKQAHFTWELKCEAETLYEIWEGATVTNAGTAITPINKNRNSSNTSIQTIKYQSNTSLALANADTSVVGATLIARGVIGAGRSGGDVVRATELILKSNTVYCFRAVANAAGYINFNVEWYEHTPKN